MINSTPREFASSGIRTNEKGKKEYVEEKMSRAHRGLQEPEDVGDTGITDGRGQRVEEDKEAWSLSTANKAGGGGFHARSRFAIPSCPLLDACQSGV